MSTSVERGEIVALVETRVENVNLRRHMLATEAVMRAVAPRLGGDPGVWAIAGLAHDIDSEATADDFARHGSDAAATLRDLGVPGEVVHAVAAHNPATGVEAGSPLDVALIACDQVTGLITAATLVRPDRDVTQVKVKSLRKRMREGAFARGVDRASIARCEELGLPLDEFLQVSLEAMQSIAGDLGLDGESRAAPPA